MDRQPAIQHCPVMEHETLAMLTHEQTGTYVDCTLGGGGHTRALLQSSPSIVVIGIDRDADCIAAARQWGRLWDKRFIALHGDFRHLQHLLTQHGYQHVDGILFDLGVSSYQLDTAWRGFSFRHDGPLDMRMDTTQSTTAYTLVNHASAEQLDRWLSALSGERWAKRIAHAIVEARRHEAIATTGQLAALVERTIPRSAWPPRVHPATRTFLALRMAVNDELPALAEALPQAVEALHSGGRLCLLTFHSAEHRQVKMFLHQEIRGCVCPPRLPLCRCGRQPRLRLLHRKPLLPTADEIQANPRSRSAQLRAAVKLATLAENKEK